jgi:hypothetical protein
MIGDLVRGWAQRRQLRASIRTLYSKSIHQHTDMVTPTREEVERDLRAELERRGVNPTPELIERGIRLYDNPNFRLRFGLGEVRRVFRELKADEVRPWMLPPSNAIDLYEFGDGEALSFCGDELDWNVVQALRNESVPDEDGVVARSV